MPSSCDTLALLSFAATDMRSCCDSIAEALPSWPAILLLTSTHLVCVERYYVWSCLDG